MRQRRGSTGEVLMPHEMAGNAAPQGQDALDATLTTAAAAAHARVTSVLSATADIEAEELEQQRAVQVGGGECWAKVPCPC